MDHVVERELVVPVTPGEMWDALTEGARLSAWFGADAEIDPRPGSTATFRWPDGTQRRALVEVVEPPRVLTFRWLPFERRPDGRVGPAPGSRVEFRCEETPEGTRLKITETPAGRPSRLWSSRVEEVRT